LSFCKKRTVDRVPVEDCGKEKKPRLSLVNIVVDDAIKTAISPTEGRRRKKKKKKRGGHWPIEGAVRPGGRKRPSLTSPGKE